MSKTKKEHYVPQSYLRRFSSDGKQIHVYDKILKRSFTSGIRDVAQESHFYDIPRESFPTELKVSEEDLQAVEKAFNKIEGLFSQTVEEVLSLTDDISISPIASMVLISLPSATEAGRMQVLTALPSRCTVQAPQAATPQPYFVPVIWRTSRNTQSKGMAGSASIECSLPFMRRFIANNLLPCEVSIFPKFTLSGFPGLPSRVGKVS